MSKGEVALRTRERLDAAVAALGSSEASGRQDRVEVGSHQVSNPCPARAYGPQEPYAESAPKAARRVGIAALRLEAGPPGDRVDVVLSTAGALPPALEDWVGGLDRAGRAAVAAEATAWVADALALTGAGELRWSEARPSKHTATAGVCFAASVDAGRRTREGEERLLVLRRRAEPRDPQMARHIALVWALTAGVVAESVVFGYRDDLAKTPHPFGDDEMTVAIEEAAEHAGWALTPSSAPTVPGTWCGNCHLADQCDSAAGAAGGMIQLSGAEPTM